MRVLLALVAAAAAAAPAGAAPSASGFTFGIAGGNIRPYTVTIAPGGAVTTTGPVQVGRRHLRAAQLLKLREVAALVRFEALPQRTECAGVLPDVAASFIRTGGRTVQVHGSCGPRFNRLWRALTVAVGLSR